MFFWPQTVENRAAIRTALAALAAVLISFKFHLETPFWSGMSVVVVSNLYTGNIIDKAMLRIIGTIAGAFLGFYVAGLVANSFLLYFLSCFSIMCIGSYYYSFSVNGYAYLLGALCAFLIISQVAVSPQNAFFVAIWRPVEIGIGVLVSAISAYFIFPNHLKDNIDIQLHDIFTDFSVGLGQLLSMLNDGKPDFDVLAQDNLKIKKKLRKAVELIGAMNYELGVTKARTDQVRALLDIFYDLSRRLQYLILISPQHGDLTIVQSLSIQPVLNAIQADLKQLQMAFSNQEMLLELKTETGITELEQRVKQMQKGDEGVFLHLHPKVNSDMEAQEPAFKSNFAYAFIHFLHQVNQSLLLMHSLLSHIPFNMTVKLQVLKTRERIRTDMDVIKRSIKAGFSVILALGFWMVTNWPGGLNGIISSLVISIRKNLFEMKNVSIHRILGCVLGGGIALVSLFLIKMDLYDFILIFFLSIWAFTYFMFKVPKYSYIGLQANIALIISLAQEGGPPVYLGPPLQRLGGIVIGIVASFIVANLIWRSDVWTMLNRYLNKLYVYIGQNLKQILLTSENQKKIHDLANLFWTSRGLLESLVDEPLSTKKQSLLTELWKRFDSLVMIQATISHILGAINRDKVEETARLLGCDLFFYEHEVCVAFNQHDTAYGLKLSHQLQDLLSEIDKKRAFAQVPDNDLRGFLAYINALNQLVLRIH
ncbi:p-hydroxybenzoic acid efflux pump subunit AaeB [Legionella steigerwaltii]|uniref:p-hydroxybenzoic acid efflux pump subunit AaeB n=1 Tax=Legionella steigerwaltii TaxID=460 RepID=A0A378L761_9GAMM|nr:FUSC family protein [Legionella steigerwaltii]KTD77491.1 p-hydroxybenzoic acid efflux pump subunit AaeB [Legionella steigerwaltii]STY22653.1 p-hydroxybenzoic acid efflux pump subunit AaeB [Legionella steigerwaltii]